MGGPTWRRNKLGPGLGETTFANEGTLRRSRDDRSANAVGFHPPVLEGSRRPVTKVFRKDHYCWLPSATHWAHSFRYHRDAELAAGALANLLFWVERREVRLPPPPRPKISC